MKTASEHKKNEYLAKDEKKYSSNNNFFLREKLVLVLCGILTIRRVMEVRMTMKMTKKKEKIFTAIGHKRETSKQEKESSKREAIWNINFGTFL